MKTSKLPRNKPLYIGALSGTSLDAIDLALISIQNHCPVIDRTFSSPWPEAQQKRLRQITSEQAMSFSEWGRLDQSVAANFAQATQLAIQEWEINAQDVVAMGFHGQTLAHGGQDKPAWSLQVGNAHYLAALTGLTVVAGFRQTDMAFGGQGAPLAPALHQQLLLHTDYKVDFQAVLNLGGIANISLIKGENCIGFDTGPANCLLDDWYRQHHSGPFDPSGQWADSGQCIPELLAAMLKDDFFQKQAPKSACKNQFSLSWLQAFLSPEYQAEDIQATLRELTVQTVCQAIQNHASETLKALWVVGGGVHHPGLMKSLQSNLSGTKVHSGQDIGLSPDFMEAQLFAWLAYLRMEGIALDMKGITGSQKKQPLGTVYF